VEQVFRIERVVRDLDGRNERREVTVGVTSLRANTLRGTARTLLKFNREHWGIENSLHWVRDVTLDEDRSRVRKGAAAQAMASLRNVVISLLRLAGATNIARALRHLAHHPTRALRLIGV
jgi:hypothetical protein